MGMCPAMGAAVGQTPPHPPHFPAHSWAGGEHVFGQGEAAAPSGHDALPVLPRSGPCAPPPQPPSGDRGTPEQPKTSRQGPASISLCCRLRLCKPGESHIKLLKKPQTLSLKLMFNFVTCTNRQTNYWTIYGLNCTGRKYPSFVQPNCFIAVLE